jgi:hypothetical protein
MIEVSNIQSIEASQKDIQHINLESGHQVGRILIK